MKEQADVAQADVTQAEVARLEAEMAEVCGLLNAATARLVALIGQVLATGAWPGFAIRSAEHWVTWKCGVSARRARELVGMARRLPELAATRAAFAAGELAEDQVAVIARHSPAAADADAAALAKAATVTQLRRVLGSYRFGTPLRAEGAEGEEQRRVSFGYDEEGTWRLRAALPPDEGALWERALGTARDELYREGAATEAAANPTQVCWADAAVAVAERSLGASAALRPHRDRHLVLLHLGTDGDGNLGAHLHGGPGVAPGLRRYLSCDARLRAVVEAEGRALSVGRAHRIVPERTRVAIEERHGGCRVPGCGHTRWLQVHHVTHWEDGGPTDTANLVALCSRHHRLHHRGLLGVEGDADDAEGLVFTDARGRRLTGCGRPAPPGPDLAVTARGL
ncbi:MAG TPA: DUF222 domain-containing protein, partial [Acidimicrobiales bacterium]|nr:DUF222 domain-containing protein [Acidimicrobiales bacterium]